MPRNPATRRMRALLATGRIVAAHHIVLHLEHLLADRDRRPGGLNDPSTSRAADVVRSPTARSIVRRVAFPGPARALDVAALLAGAAQLAGHGGAIAPATLAVTRALAAPATGHGSDGSDPVALTTATVLTIARSARDPRTVDACLWFLALYAAHSYLVSGLAKATSRPWRDGAALRSVLATRNYGDPSWYRLVSAHPALTRTATNAVVLGESLFPLALLLRRRWAVAGALHTMTAFHLGVAWTMGLNRFVPAFVSLQPAVRYVTGPRTGSPGEEPRDDLFPRVAAALTPVAVGALVVAAHRDRRLTLRLRPDDEHLRLPGGERLRVRRAGRSDRGGPVVVLVHGMGATLEHWDVLVRELAETRALLAYDRPGCGGSPSTGAAGHLAAELDRLRTVVATTGDRPVVLVGHTTGAHLVWALAAELDEQRLLGTVLVEGLHPQELAAFGRTGPRSGRATDRAAAVHAFWARNGLGPLLDTPPWLTEVPADIRTRVGAQQRRPGLWRAAQAEWLAFTAEEHASARARPRGPVVVVSAQRSGRLLRPGDDRLGVAAGVPGARHEVLPGCGPSDVLWRAEPVARLATIVTGLGGIA